MRADMRAHDVRMYMYVCMYVCMYEYVIVCVWLGFSYIPVLLFARYINCYQLYFGSV